MKLGKPRCVRALVQEKVKAHAPQPYSCKQGTNDKVIPPTLQGQSETTITGNFPGRVLPYLPKYACVSERDAGSCILNRV